MKQLGKPRADDLPRDVNQLGKRIVHLATRDRDDPEPKAAKPKPRRRSSR